MPNISNVAVASGTGLSTAGNGGSKLTRLQNGALVSAVRSSTTSWRLLKSMDNGANWSQIATITETVNDIALESNGNDIHVLVSFSTGVKHYRYNDSGVLQGSAQNVDTGQSWMGNLSLAINEAGTELHAAWASKNATYPNSFNIRYAKGTINGDGSVTWGAVELLSTDNASGYNLKNPSILVGHDSKPKILAEHDASSRIVLFTNSFTGNPVSVGTNPPWGNKLVYDGVSRAQSSPAALFVPQSINGLANGRLWVAWHGKDATDSAKFNIRVSYSDDDGVTWATPVKLTSGNTYDRLNVTLSADKTGKVFALYEDHQWAPDIGVRMKTYNGSWGAETSVATADTAEQHPSALVDFTLQMTTPPFVYTDTTLGIRFTGNFSAGASVSPVSGALGNKETASITAYTVTPEAGSTVTQIVERINGVIVNTFNNPASLSRTLTAPTATWDTLAYYSINDHAASITVTDSNGAATTTSYTFEKTLADEASLLEGAAAAEDTLNRISTKRDALAAQVGLSAGSTFDAISAQLASGAVFKKFATGTVTSSSTTLSFQYVSGSSVELRAVTVSGLTFKPSMIVLTASTGSMIYVEGESDYPKKVLIAQYNNAGTTQATHNVKGDVGSAYVNSAGFRLPSHLGSFPYTWIAYG